MGSDDGGWKYSDLFAQYAHEPLVENIDDENCNVVFKILRRGDGGQHFVLDVFSHSTRVTLKRKMVMTKMVM